MCHIAYWCHWEFSHFIVLNSYVINLTEKCSNSSYFIKFHDPPRLTKFVRRLHTMLTQERSKGVIEWRRGLLVLYSMEAFTNELLPRYFNTHNFKTFRRQLNYYGFVHVRSQATSGSKSTALWANPELVNSGSDSISSVLKLRRVEASETSKTPEGRRGRKNEVASSIKVDVDGLGISVSEIYNTPSPKRSSALITPPIPASIICEGPPPTQVEHCEADHGYDSRIDEAAGLLVSILHAHPWLRYCSMFLIKPDQLFKVELVRWFDFCKSLTKVTKAIDYSLFLILFFHQPTSMYLIWVYMTSSVFKICFSICNLFIIASGSPLRSRLIFHSDIAGDLNKSSVSSEKPTSLM